MARRTALARTALAAVDRTYRPAHGAVRLGDDIDLALGRVHEATGSAADMFAILVASQLRGPVLWIGGKNDVGTLAPAGLQDFLDPTRLILAIGASRPEILWAAEQAMRMPGAACAVIELGDGPSLHESRRMQIAAEQGGGLGIVLVSGRPQTSAAQTRWQCEAINHGKARWLWRLTKNRSGPVGAWTVGWQPPGERDNHAAGIIHLAANAAA